MSSNNSNNLLTILGWASVTTTTGLLLYAAYTLVAPIVVPPIQTYPWTLPDDYDQKQREKKMTVVMAGSYNPPHRGHLAMISYLAERYGQVLVVIGMNPNKTYAVTPPERAKLLQTMCQGIPNVRVEVVKGYIWRFAKQPNNQAKLFFRGIRTWEKDGADERSLQILNTWGPLLLGPLWWPIPTRFLEGKPEYNHISSTLIRDLCAKPGFQTSDVHELVPESVAEDVVRLYGVARQ
eukprot:scaffold3240_cov187-Amphora_coffeaeformis.AAC.5